MKKKIKAYAGFHNDEIDFCICRDSGKEIMSIFKKRLDALVLYECIIPIEIIYEEPK